MDSKTLGEAQSSTDHFEIKIQMNRSNSSKPSETQIKNTTFYTESTKAMMKAHILSDEEG